MQTRNLYDDDYVNFSDLDKELFETIIDRLSWLK